MIDGGAMHEHLSCRFINNLQEELIKLWDCKDRYLENDSTATITYDPKTKNIRTEFNLEVSYNPVELENIYF